MQEWGGCHINQPLVDLGRQVTRFKHQSFCPECLGIVGPLCKDGIDDLPRGLELVVGQMCGSQEKLALAVIWRLFEQSLESSPTGRRVTLLPLRPCGEQQLGLSLPLVIIETI